MQQKNRRKRPPVTRTEPDRSFAGWVGPGTPRDGRAAPQSPEREPSPPPDGRERTYQAVNGAYRLIDEYLRQGQKMAEELWLPAEASSRAEGARDAPMRFMRAMGDMTMAWMEVMQQWTASGAQPPVGAGEAGPFTAGRPAPPRPAEGSEREGGPVAARPLRVAVKAAVPVEVSVHLADGTDLSDLVVSELRTFGGDPASIRSVVVDAGERGDPPVLRIAVPPGQAAGTYSGLLVSRGSQKPRGTVSLVVS